MKTFSIRESLRFGWKEFKKHPWPFIGVTLIYFAISMLTDIKYVGIIFYILSLAAMLGYTKVMLNAVDGVRPSPNVLFSQWNKFWRLLGVSILLGLMIMVPAAIVMGIIFVLDLITISIVPMGGLDLASGALVPLIILGLALLAYILWISAKYYFSIFILVDRNTKVMESLKLSSKITNGHKWKVAAFFIVSAIFAMLGLIALVVGVVVTTIIAQIAMAYVYRKLLAKHLGATAVAEPQPNDIAPAESHLPAEPATAEPMPAQPAN